MKLTFDGVQYGDALLDAVPMGPLASPPIVSAGIYRPKASLNTDSKNQYWVLYCGVRMTRDDPAALTMALADLMEKMGKKGIVQLLDDDDSVRVATDNEWVFFDCSKPVVREGWGGRTIDRWDLEFRGIEKMVGA